MIVWFVVLDSGSAVSFSACGFLDLRLCAMHLLCAFCVVTVGFVSLYVSEFLIAACGVSPLRGRPALAKAQGLDPNAFYFGCGSVGAVRLICAK